MKKLIYPLLLSIGLIGCELSSLQVEETNYGKGQTISVEEGIAAEITTDQESTEIYTLDNIALEIDALENGYEPAIGKEKRLEWLKSYMQWAEEGMQLAIIRPKIPMPVCPPLPKADCKYPNIHFSQLSISFYCYNPEYIHARIDTEEGELGTLKTAVYNENNRSVTVTFELLNEELLPLPSVISIDYQSEDGEQNLQAEIAGDIFY